MAQGEVADNIEWVTMREAAARLGISTASLRSLAADGSIEIRWRGGRPGVSWTSVEAYIERSRITGRVRDPPLRQVGPDRPVRGVALMDRVKARFDWSDHDPADALGVWQSVVSRYRISAVPTHQVERLRTLARLSPAEVGPPRRRVPKRGAAGLPPYAKERAVGRDRQAGACKGSAVSERRDPKARDVAPLGLTLGAQPWGALSFARGGHGRTRAHDS